MAKNGTLANFGYIFNSAIVHLIISIRISINHSSPCTQSPSPPSPSTPNLSPHPISNYTVLESISLHSERARRSKIPDGRDYGQPPRPRSLTRSGLRPRGPIAIGEPSRDFRHHGNGPRGKAAATRRHLKGPSRRRSARGRAGWLRAPRGRARADSAPSRPAPQTSRINGLISDLFQRPPRPWKRGPAGRSRRSDGFPACRKEDESGGGAHRASRERSAAVSQFFVRRG